MKFSVLQDSGYSAGKGNQGGASDTKLCCAASRMAAASFETAKTRVTGSFYEDDEDAEFGGGLLLDGADGVYGGTCADERYGPG
jgi:hypothetical protein